MSKNKQEKSTISFQANERLIEMLDFAVDKAVYHNRSAAIRDAIRQLYDKHNE